MDAASRCHDVDKTEQAILGEAQRWSSWVTSEVAKVIGQKKLLALQIEFRGARERELASVGKNALSEDGHPLLTVFRRLPFANVQNQDAGTSKRARKRGEHRSACVVIHEVVENAAAKNAVVPRHR